MITEDYVSFKVAKLLKEKGFDIPVNYEYHYKITIPQFHKKKHNFNGIEYRNCLSEWYSAPTHQMVCKWLREVHNLFIMVDCGVGAYVWSVVDMSNGNIILKVDAVVGSYEEAVETSLKYCLENLI